MQALDLDAVIADLARRIPPVLDVHKAFVRAAFAPDTAIAALSVARGNAKTRLAGGLAAMAITPGSALWRGGALEVLGVAASLEQGRLMLDACRDALGDRAGDYRWLTSGQRLAVTGKATGARFRILSSSAKRALGLANFSLILADEPAAWEGRGGAAMYDALRTSLGKREGARLLLIGTRAPAAPDSWWSQLLDAGSGRGVHVAVLDAPAGAPWHDDDVILAANPMAQVNGTLRTTLFRERDEARRNPTLQPAFQAYRLNRLVGVDRDLLLSLSEWQAVLARPVPPREGAAVVGLDVGGARSWSALWAQWPNGRAEAFAVVPGIPEIDEREKADAVPAGLYRRLVENGSLIVDDGRHMARPALLIDAMVESGICPREIICDRFLLGELNDAVAGRWPVNPRRTRWSESTEDIAAFRRAAKDGNLAVEPRARGLIALSLAEATVRTEDGNARIEKARGGRSRDDLAIAGTLAIGATERNNRQAEATLVHFGEAGGVSIVR